MYHFKYHFGQDDYGWLSFIPENIREFLVRFQQRAKIEIEQVAVASPGRGALPISAFRILLEDEYCPTCNWSSRSYRIPHDKCCMHFTQYHFIPLFIYIPNNEMSLEDAFDDWLKRRNPDLINEKPDERVPVEAGYYM
jgi:hypothetical protein